MMEQADEPWGSPVGGPYAAGICKELEAWHVEHSPHHLPFLLCSTVPVPQGSFALEPSVVQLVMRTVMTASAERRKENRYLPFL